MFDLQKIASMLVALSKTTKDVEENMEKISEIAGKVAYTTHAFGDDKVEDLMFDIYYYSAEAEDAEAVAQLIKDLAAYAA